MNEIKLTITELKPHYRSCAYTVHQHNQFRLSPLENYSLTKGD